MAVTEALMTLFLRETVSIERVAAAAQRIQLPAAAASASKAVAAAPPPEATDQEEALLRWVSACCAKVKTRAEAELEDDEEEEEARVSKGEASHVGGGRSDGGGRQGDKPRGVC